MKYLSLLATLVVLANPVSAFAITTDSYSRTPDANPIEDAGDVIFNYAVSDLNQDMPPAFAQVVIEVEGEEPLKGECFDDVNGPSGFYEGTDTFFLDYGTYVNSVAVYFYAGGEGPDNCDEFSVGGGTLVDGIGLDGGFEVVEEPIAYADVYSKIPTELMANIVVGTTTSIALVGLMIRALRKEGTV